MWSKRFSILTVAGLMIGAGIAQGQSAVRKVDFKNFTYQPFCAGEETEDVAVKDGEFYEEKKIDEYTDRFHFRIFSIEYGDLDGDRIEEASILSVCNTGGTGNFTEGYIYKIKKGKAQLAARLIGGDRAYGGLKSARIKNGILAVERYDPGENGANCCPEFILNEKYRLEIDKLIQIGRGVQSDIYPKQRITFDKGTSGKTFTVSIPAQDRKRFVLGAKAGQRLAVSSGSTDAELRLLEDARVTEGIHNFLAVLPKTGDYTIEVINPTDKTISFTLNVKIN